MKRIIFDVPRWHAYLHRDARGLEIAKDKDDPVRKFEDELFDRLYSGESERLPPRQQDPKLRAWAEGVHAVRISVDGERQDRRIVNGRIGRT